MTDIMPLLQELGGFGAATLWAWTLVFLRVGAALALLPAFGEQSVPQRLRLVLALAFTAVVAPAVFDKVPQAGLLLPAAIEIVAGLVLGISLRLFVMALQTAGAIVAQAISLSQVMGNAGPEPQPAVTHLFVMAALALAVMNGLHVRVAEFLILSYQILPPGAFPGVEEFTAWGTSQTAQAFSLAFSLAAPFTIAAFLYNLALAVINRAMPSLMVSFIGAPALSGGGLVLLFLLSPLLLSVWLLALGDHLGGSLGALP